MTYYMHVIAPDSGRYHRLDAAKPVDRPTEARSPGDIVACFSEELGEWTAAQVTDLNPSWKMAGVLELDW